jgi:polyhydroxyalkanoate synthesis repressor PhaR
MLHYLLHCSNHNACNGDVKGKNKGIEMTRKPVIIKKYENRRLYDATNSRYINLDEIARMVRDGQELRVVDAVSGEDLTRLILTQIIVEDAKEPDSTFPLDILRQMVVASGKATQENMVKYMKSVVDMYQNAYRALTPLGPMDFVPGMPRPSQPSEHQTAGNTTEQELRQRVEELETLMARMAEQKNAPVKTGAKKSKTRSRSRRKI